MIPAEILIPAETFVSLLFASLLEAARILTIRSGCPRSAAECDYLFMFHYHGTDILKAIWNLRGRTVRFPAEEAVCERHKIQR
jgi:hypothetical protein